MATGPQMAKKESANENIQLVVAQLWLQKKYFGQIKKVGL